MYIYWKIRPSCLQIAHCYILADSLRWPIAATLHKLILAFFFFFFTLLVFFRSTFHLFASVCRQCLASSEWWRACRRLTIWWRTPRSNTGTGTWRGRRSTTRGETEAKVSWRRPPNAERFQPQKDWTVNCKKDSDQHQEARSPALIAESLVTTALIDFLLDTYEFKPVVEITHVKILLPDIQVYCLMTKLLCRGTMKSTVHLRVFY